MDWIILIVPTYGALGSCVWRLIILVTIAVVHVLFTVRASLYRLEVMVILVIVGRVWLKIISHFFILSLLSYRVFWSSQGRWEEPLPTTNGPCEHQNTWYNLAPWSACCKHQVSGATFTCLCLALPPSDLMGARTPGTCGKSYLGSEMVLFGTITPLRD
jgi:hypothetical protein